MGSLRLGGSMSGAPAAPPTSNPPAKFTAGAARARSVRGRGVGASLVLALHHVARQNGRTLITLSTRRGESAEEFYKALGYKEAGVIPGWTIGGDGESYDHVTLYQELS